jgi:hypothetical protein
MSFKVMWRQGKLDYPLVEITEANMKHIQDKFGNDQLKSAIPTHFCVMEGRIEYFPPLLPSVTCEGCDVGLPRSSDGWHLNERYHPVMKCIHLR